MSPPAATVNRATTSLIREGPHVRYDHHELTAASFDEGRTVSPANSQLAEDLVECLTPLNATARAMFGGYCVYIDGKVVALVCDERIFIKPSSADTALSDYAEPAPAYAGAKESWRLPVDALENDPIRVIQIVEATAAALPAKRPRRRA